MDAARSSSSSRRWGSREDRWPAAGHTTSKLPALDARDLLPGLGEPGLWSLMCSTQAVASLAHGRHMLLTVVVSSPWHIGER
jgi:hypothetical protein